MPSPHTLLNLPLLPAGEVPALGTLRPTWHIVCAARQLAGTGGNSQVCEIHADFKGSTIVYGVLQFHTQRVHDGSALAHTAQVIIWETMLE